MADHKSMFDQDELCAFRRADHILGCDSWFDSCQAGCDGSIPTDVHAPDF